jgi:hypothetical protein
MRKIFLTLLIILFLCSCRRDYQCSNQAFGITFIGYPKADIDSFVIRRYVANTNFQQVIDSAVNTLETSSYIASNDSTMVSYVSPMSAIQYGNDWQIYVPGINKTVSLSNIMAFQKSGSCSVGLGTKTLCYCVNPVQSANVDGQMIMYPTPDSTFKGYKIYIKN